MALTTTVGDLHIHAIAPAEICFVSIGNTSSSSNRICVKVQLISLSYWEDYDNADSFADKLD